MTRLSRAAVFAVGLAVAFATALPVSTRARAADLPPSLRSFGAAKAISAYELSADGVAGVSLQPHLADSSSFAASTVLSPNLALDAGRGLDIAARFGNYDDAASPFLSSVDAPFLGLANGGRYSGATFVPAANLRMRVGAALNSERLDHFAFDPITAVSGNMPLTYEPSQTRSLLAGLSYDISTSAGIDISGISSSRSGVPLGFENAAGIAPKSSTNALGVAAHMGIGQGWVTSASFSEGMTQLDLRGGQGATLPQQSYSIAVAKHGLFGDDALGLSLSRPAPNLTGSFSSLMGSGEMPSLVIARGQALAAQAPETDFQLGYVTNFLDGAVALQTNAAYQVNSQGQTGTNSVTLLSRAKIKF
jgi:hypothetical protein